MKRFFLNPIFLGGLAVLILSLAVWFVGELFTFSEGVWFRLIVIGVMVLIWLGYSIFWFIRRRKKNKELVEEIADASDPTGGAISDEDAELRRKFSEALKDLGKLRFKGRLGGRKYLYELPWYIFIGPPGAGKTTALKNCGLEFPLQKGDEIALDGVAGTRNCDWVFTNDAVFIDTAGRYVTQDSNQDVDRAAWRNFLGLLTKTRPNEPINGVILSISVGEIAMASAVDIDNHAAAIRQRLTELSDVMKANIPVYVMFTKADLLVGFTEFFQMMNPQEREQVWGTTFPLEGLDDVAGQVNRNLQRLPTEFDSLINRMGELQFARMQEEVDLTTRSKIFGFPAQFSSMKPVVERFLTKVFEPDRYSVPFLLRGFYFTSATQVGQPVDRLISRMAQNFGLERQVVGMLSGSGRSYFLADLLKKTIFPEAGIIRGTGKSRLGGTILKVTGLVACFLLPVFLGLGFWAVYSHNQDLSAEVQEGLSAYDVALQDAGLAEIDVDTGDVVLTPVDDEELAPVLPPITLLLDEYEEMSGEEGDPPLWGMGVDDSDSIKEQMRNAYQQSLDDLVRPRILAKIERQMDENLHKPELLYDYLKAYLIIGGRGPLDADYVREFLTIDWENTYGGVENAPLREQLNRHLEVMLEVGFRDRELNEDAIARAQAAVTQISFAERAYRIILRSSEARALEPWSLSAAGGRTTKDVFIRQSGKSLDDPVPGIFTYTGFWKFFLPNVNGAASAALEEKWLLGEDGGDDENARIAGELLQVYYEDYIKTWNDLLGDLRFVPFANGGEAKDILNLISSRRSPLTEILQKADLQTRLARYPGEDSPLLKEAVTLGFFRLNKKSVIGSRLLKASEGKEEDKPGFPVQESFAELGEFVGADISGTTDLAQLIAALDRLYDKVNNVSAASPGELKVLAQTTEAQKLLRLADNAPRSVGEMIRDMLEQVSTVTTGNFKKQLQEAWTSSIVPRCRQTIHGRYPFGRGDDVPIVDMEEILGPQGVLDRFFNNNLASFVDTDVTPWRWNPSGSSLGFSTNTLRFFETTANLRKAFFPKDSPTAALRIGVIPSAFEPGVAIVRYEVGGSVAVMEAGAETPTTLNWPGTQPAAGAALSIEFNELEGDLLTSDERGEWGFFRLLDKLGKRKRRDGAIFRATLKIGGRGMFANLSFGTAVNPLALQDVIRKYKCPTKL